MTVLDYRTRDGLADYGFSIEFDPNVGWRAYIVFQPFYGDRDDSRQWPINLLTSRDVAMSTGLRSSIAWETQKRSPRCGPSWSTGTSASLPKGRPPQLVKPASATQPGPVRHAQDIRMTGPALRTLLNAYSWQR
jgi:hypothetical protein